MNKIGIDIGGTKIECCVLSPTNKILFRERIPTGNVYEETVFLYNKALIETKTTQHTVGVCMPGSISKTTGLLKNSSLQFLNGTDFVRILESKLNCRIQTANDSQCFALAEALLGAGVSHRTVFGMILGTGVGGGLVISGRLYKGLHGICTEWGHTNLDASNNIQCRCGRIGCVETWLSGSGLSKWAEVMYNENLSAQQYLKSPTVESIYLNRFGLAVANLIQTIDPDCIVIGGGISNNEILYTKGLLSVKKFLYNDDFSTPIYKAKLGDSAGVIGAALLWSVV